MNTLKKLSHVQMLVLGYALVTVIGALLLMLPVSSRLGTWQPFIDALFVATSGISTSGLSVVDIGGYYTLFGQIVLLCIFQIGGIGYMTFIMFLAYMLGKQISIKTRLVAQESLATDHFHPLTVFFKKVLFYTLAIEAVGGIVLATVFMREYSATYALYLGMFHSVSAFCTAGFSTLATSLVHYQTDTILNLTVNIVSLIGGIGFFVLIDLENYLYKKRNKISPRRLTLHSKMALRVTAIIITAGSIIIFVSEQWNESYTVMDRLMISVFQSISASTTDGYNSIDIGTMSMTSLTMLMMLMFIGASPGSTGGGIKTTTLGAMLMALKSCLRGEEQVTMHGRELSTETITKAFTVFSLFALIALIDIIILANTETGSYLQTLFEIISALGNTGLSTGITAALTKTGRIVLIITMFIGRVGPLAIGTALLAKSEKNTFRCPREDLFIG